MVHAAFSTRVPAGSSATELLLHRVCWASRGTGSYTGAACCCRACSRATHCNTCTLARGMHNRLQREGVQSAQGLCSKLSICKLTKHSDANRDQLIDTGTANPGTTKTHRPHTASGAASQNCRKQTPQPHLNTASVMSFGLSTVCTRTLKRTLTSRSREKSATAPSALLWLQHAQKERCQLLWAPSGTHETKSPQIQSPCGDPIKGESSVAGRDIATQKRRDTHTTTTTTTTKEGE
jgi:hypothetical protein